MTDDISNLADIHAAIPHRAPFLFIDEVVERDERRIVCRKTFRADEFFYQGHYPHFPITPGVLLCEAAMQAGALLLSGQFGDRAGVPVATRMNDVRFKRTVRPGETIEIEVNLIERLADAFFLKAKVSCGQRVAVRLEFACTLAPLADSER
jgi:3-hydroxyacyl-[acyl-carrier-protein] dehydratase